MLIELHGELDRITIGGDLTTAATTTFLKNLNVYEEITQID
jgi:hypothetical protein